MSRGAGFTLVEMLVVVSIIVTLAAILLPVYEVVNKRAEAVHCQSNMRSLAMAAGLYAEDNDGVLVPALCSCGPAGTFGTGWDVPLLAYHKVEALYLCLADQRPSWATSTVCYKHSYGINFDLTMVGGYPGNALSVAEVETPTRVILLFEIAGSARALGLSYDLHGLNAVEARHNTGCNFAFLDGHAKWYRLKQTEKPENLWLVH